MGWPAWLAAALRVTDRPWAIGAGARTLFAAGAIAAVGAAAGHLESVGIAFFGVACAVAFIGEAVFRTQAVAVAAQACGALTGMGIAALTGGPEASAQVKVAMAVLVALVSGMVGAIGRETTAFATMLVIGLAFGQFADIDLPWGWQATCYVAGSAVALLAAVPAWLAHPRGIERGAVADVFAASARLLAAEPPALARARDDLAAASAAARAAIYDHRFRRGNRGSARRRRLDAAMGSAEAVSLAAVAITRSDLPVPPDAVRVVAEVGRDVRQDLPVPRGHELSDDIPELAGLRSALALASDPDPPAHQDLFVPPIRTRLRAAFGRATTPGAWSAGLRLALCMGVATLLTVLVHLENHSYWLPLTVAVVVRPEYASVFVRATNRLAGTVLGALLAALSLVAFGPGWPAALCAAAATAFAVAAAPKSYGIRVIGITCAALLSGSIGVDDPVNPAIRLLDTLAGCAVALIFGYLLWPGRSRPPAGLDLTGAVAAAAAYARQATAPQAARTADFPLVRLDAYRLAHAARAAAAAGLAEPPPGSGLAAAALPRALALEDAVDHVTRVALRTEQGAPVEAAEVDALSARLRALANG